MYRIGINTLKVEKQNKKPTPKGWVVWLYPLRKLLYLHIF